MTDTCSWKDQCHSENIWKENPHLVENCGFVLGMLILSTSRRNRQMAKYLKDVINILIM